MTTATIYRAVDGREFYTEQECLQYEATVLNAKPQMWNWKGELTDDIESAVFVHLANLSEATWFLNKADEWSTSSDGIDEEMTGWFYWDECDEHYVWIDEDLVKVIRKSAMTVATEIPD